MKTRIFALMLAMVMALGLSACGATAQPKQDPPTQDDPAPTTLAPQELKLGLILVGELDDAYNSNHLEGLQAAARQVGADPAGQILVKSSVPEDQTCEEAVNQLVEAGCQIIFANGVGHEPYMVQAAADHPDIQFCTAGGSLSAGDQLDNSHNYFAEVHQARYLSGIAAGLKTETDRLGYVATTPTAEVISGFTAFYLGAKSVNPNVELYVNYTGQWSDAAAEAANAQALIDQGCDVIGQHAGTTAPASTAEANGVWVVGYNDDMVTVAPLAALCSARINWSVYYAYALEALMAGTQIDQDWCGSYGDGAVYVSDLNEAVVADGTAEAIKTAADALAQGTRHVFAGPLTGANADGDTINLTEGQYFTENETSSAPSWDYIIPGVNLLS